MKTGFKEYIGSLTARSVGSDTDSDLLRPNLGRCKEIQHKDSKSRRNAYLRNERR